MALNFKGFGFTFEGKDKNGLSTIENANTGINDLGKSFEGTAKSSVSFVSKINMLSNAFQNLQLGKIKNQFSKVGGVINSQINDITQNNDDLIGSFEEFRFELRRLYSGDAKKYGDALSAVKKYGVDTGQTMVDSGRDFMEYMKVFKDHANALKFFKTSGKYIIAMGLESSELAKTTNELSTGFGVSGKRIETILNMYHKLGIKMGDVKGTANEFAANITLIDDNLSKFRGTSAELTSVQSGKAFQKMSKSMLMLAGAYKNVLGGDIKDIMPSVTEITKTSMAFANYGTALSKNLNPENFGKSAFGDGIWAQMLFGDIGPIKFGKLAQDPMKLISSISKKLKGFKGNSQYDNVVQSLIKSFGGDSNLAYVFQNYDKIIAAQDGMNNALKNGMSVKKAFNHEMSTPSKAEASFNSAKEALKAFTETLISADMSKVWKIRKNLLDKSSVFFKNLLNSNSKIVVSLTKSFLIFKKMGFIGLLIHLFGGDVVKNAKKKSKDVSGSVDSIRAAFSFLGDDAMTAISWIIGGLGTLAISSKSIMSTFSGIFKNDGVTKAVSKIGKTEAGVFSGLFGNSKEAGASIGMFAKFGKKIIKITKMVFWPVVKVMKILGGMLARFTIGVSLAAPAIGLFGARAKNAMTTIEKLSHVVKAGGNVVELFGARFESVSKLLSSISKPMSLFTPRVLSFSESFANTKYVAKFFNLIKSGAASIGKLKGVEKISMLFSKFKSMPRVAKVITKLGGALKFATIEGGTVQNTSKWINKLSRIKKLIPGFSKFSNTIRNVVSGASKAGEALGEVSKVAGEVGDVAKSVGRFGKFGKIFGGVLKIFGKIFFYVTVIKDVFKGIGKIISNIGADMSINDKIKTVFLGIEDILWNIFNDVLMGIPGMIMDAFNKAGKNISVMFDNIASNITNLFDWEAVGKSLRDNVAFAIKWIKKAIDNMFSSTKKGVKSAFSVDAIFKGLGKIASSIFGVIKSIFGPLATYIGSILSKVDWGALALAIFDMLVNVILSVWDTLGKVIFKILDKINGMFGGFLTPLIDSLKKLWDGIATLFSVIVKIIKVLWPVLKIIGIVIGAIAGMIALFVVGAIKAFIDYFVGAVTMIAKVVTGIINIFVGLWDIIYGIFTGDSNMIKEGVSRLLNGIVQIFVGMWEYIKGIGNVFYDILIWPFVTAWDFLFGHTVWSTGTIGEIFDSVLGVLKSIGTFILDALIWPFEKGWSFISDIFDKIKDLFSGIGQWIWDNLVPAPLKWVLGKIGIGSSDSTTADTGAGTSISASTIDAATSKTDVNQTQLIFAPDMQKAFAKIFKESIKEAFASLGSAGLVNIKVSVDKNGNLNAYMEQQIRNAEVNYHNNMR